MTGSIRAGSLTGEQWVFEERTTDPATTLEGERWLRTDLAPETNQIATLRVDVGSSVVDVPVFATGTSESGVNEALRVRVGGQDGYIPITSPGDATFNNLRMQHSGSTLAYHDRVAPGAATPDSAIHQHDATALSLNDGDAVTTWPDSIASADTTGGSPTYTTNAQNGNPIVAFNGVDDALNDTITAVSPPYTVISVIGIANTSSNNWYLSTNNTPRFGYDYTDTGDGFSLSNYGENVFVKPAASVGDYFVVSGVIRSSTADTEVVIRANQNQSTAADGGTNSEKEWDEILQGAAQPNDFYGESKYAESWFYNEDLTATNELQDEENRLADKWGITF